jgi:Immunity protein Imm1
MEVWMASRRADGEWRIIRVEASTYDQRNRASRSRHSCPTWDQVQVVLQSLNAGRRSDMVIEAANGSLLVIGGGQGRFHVQLTYPRGTEPPNLLLNNPSAGSETEELIVGGVSTPLPARLIVDEATALQAARRFFQDGAADPQLAWEAD